MNLNRLIEVLTAVRDDYLDGSESVRISGGKITIYRQTDDSTYDLVTTDAMAEEVWLNYNVIEDIKEQPVLDCNRFAALAEEESECVDDVPF